VNRRLELTRGRIVALIIGLPLTLAAISAFSLHTLGDLAAGSSPVHFQVPANGRTVTLSIEGGDVHVATSPSRLVKLHGLARYSLLRPVVGFRVTGFNIVMKSRCRLSITQCAFNYHLDLPAGVTANLIDGSGDITASYLLSQDVTAVSHSGNIRLSFAVIPDNVDVTTSFGHITLVLPPGNTTYRIDSSAPLGTSTIRVPTSPASTHVLTVTDTSGSITITN
jgi:Putative adhesin